MNITKQKQTHRYREQTSDYNWGGGSGGTRQGKGLRGKTTKYKINKLQGHNEQHREYNEHFITFYKISNHVVHPKLMLHCKSTILQ